MYKESTLSLLPIDVGFDPKTSSIAVEIPKGTTAVKYENGGEICTVKGGITKICNTLYKAGFKHIIAARTPNHREIRFASSRFQVQPENDNYWIPVDTLRDALLAYRNHTINDNSPVVCPHCANGETEKIAIVEINEVMAIFDINKDGEPVGEPTVEEHLKTIRRHYFCRACEQDFPEKEKELTQ